MTPSSGGGFAEALSAAGARSAHSHLPDASTGRAGAPPHAIVQVEPPPQLTEQEPVHLTSQVEPFPQDTLPLLPTVMTHFERSQLTLPLSAVVRLHVLSLQFALHEA